MDIHGDSKKSKKKEKIQFKFIQMNSIKSNYKTGEELNQMNGMFTSLYVPFNSKGEHIVHELERHVECLTRKREALSLIESHLDSRNENSSHYESTRTPNRNLMTPKRSKSDETEGFGHILLKLKQDVEFAVDKFRERESDRSALESQLDKYKKELFVLKSESLELQKLKSDYESQLQEWEFKQSQMELNVEESQNESHVLNHLMNALRKEIEISFESRQRLEHEIQELTLLEQENVHEDEDMREEMNDELEEKNVEIDALKRISKELQDQAKLSFQRHDQQTREFLDTIESLKSQIHSQEQISNSIEKNDEQMESESLLNLENNVKECFKESKDVECQVELLFESLESERMELETQLHFYKTSNSTLQEQIRICSTARDELHSQLDKMKNGFLIEWKEKEKELQNEFKETLIQKESVISDLEKRLVGLQNLLHRQRDEMDHCKLVLKCRSESLSDVSQQNSLESPLSISIMDLKTLNTNLEESLVGN